MRELLKGGKKEIELKTKILKKNDHDQKVEMERYQTTYVITTDKEGQARGRNDDYCVFLIQETTMARHD